MSVTSFEKVRKGHRFEDWMPILEFENRHKLENLKKKNDINLMYRCL